jgi:hypothetical protein
MVDLLTHPTPSSGPSSQSDCLAYSAIAAIAPATKPAKTAARTGGTGSTGSGTGAATGSLGGSAAKQPIEEPKRGKPLIVIDPGHGGIDPGAVGNTINEKQLTLAVAKALKKELEDTGIPRPLTRSRVAHRCAAPAWRKRVAPTLHLAACDLTTTRPRASVTPAGRPTPTEALAARNAIIAADPQAEQRGQQYPDRLAQRDKEHHVHPPPACWCAS